jgi:hypothetical protein
MMFDNENMGRPFKRVAVFEKGKATFFGKPPPAWLVTVMK